MPFSTSTTITAGTSQSPRSILAKYGFSHEWRIDKNCQVSPNQSNQSINPMYDCIGNLTLLQNPTYNGPVAQLGPPRKAGFINASKMLIAFGDTTTIIDPTANFSILGFVDYTIGAASDVINHTISIGSDNASRIIVGYAKNSQLGILRRHNSAGTLEQVLVFSVASTRTLYIGSLSGSNMILSINGGAFGGTTAISGVFNTSGLNVSLGAVQFSSGVELGTNEGFHWGLKQGLVTNAEAAAIYAELNRIH